MSRGHIYKLLGNPLYAGRIAHRGKIYDGQHAAIIDAETWDRVTAAATEPINTPIFAIAATSATGNA